VTFIKQLGPLFFFLPASYLIALSSARIKFEQRSVTAEKTVKKAKQTASHSMNQIK